MRKNSNISIFVLFFAFLFSFCGTWGQNEMVLLEPSSSHNNRLMYNLWVTGSWSQFKHNGFNLANNTYYGTNKTLSDTRVSFMLSNELYLSKSRFIPHFHLDIGYQNEWFKYDDRGGDNNGFSSHWLSLDWNLRFLFFSAGMKTDFFLGNNVVSNDHFSYLGINPDCFNKVAYCYYVGVFLRFTFIDLHARVGSWLKTGLNPNKMAYYNITYSRINGLYWDVAVSFRLFTSGNRLKASSSF